MRCGVHESFHYLLFWTITFSFLTVFPVFAGLVPLFGIDVWEHAYYLQYKNVRPDYVKAIFDVVNWKDISERFAKAKSG